MAVVDIRIASHDDAHWLLRCAHEGDSDSDVREYTIARALFERSLKDIADGYRGPTTVRYDAYGKQLYDFLDDDGWLRAAATRHSRWTLRIDVASDAAHANLLRELPWELLHDGTHYIGAEGPSPVAIVRRAADRTQAPMAEQLNRPLQMVMMACSVDGQAELDYEHEEALILDAMANHDAVLDVEESGTLDGLDKWLVWTQTAPNDVERLDVLHLSGHAAIHDNRPMFAMETDVGGLDMVDAERLTEPFRGRMPRLFFLSGCRTAEVVHEGAASSFCEALVHAGMPTVLGWSQKVLNPAASLAAAALYGDLATGARIDVASAHARTQLYAQRKAYGMADAWHQLRTWCDATGLGAIVTPPGAVGRPKAQRPRAETVFLYPETNRIRVCSREAFVGRRRLLQRCLRVLQTDDGQPDYATGLLIHGIGGVGKSSLTARLCERMPEHARVVMVGTVDMASLRARLSAEDCSEAALEKLQGTNEPLRQQLLTYFKNMPPQLIVFDDFEVNVIGHFEKAPELVDGFGRLDHEAANVLTDVLIALRKANSRSRVIVTSRYDFALPESVVLHRESLPAFDKVALQKKTRRLRAELGLVSDEQAVALWQHIEALSGSNARLLERLYAIAVDPEIQQEGIFAILEEQAEEFREEVLLKILIELQSENGRALLYRLACVEVPIDAPALVALAADMTLDEEALIAEVKRLIAVGLVERFEIMRAAESELQTASSGEHGRLVSSEALERLKVERLLKEQLPATFHVQVSQVVHSLAAGHLDEMTTKNTSERLAKQLHGAWWENNIIRNDEEVLEIHRLAILGHTTNIRIEIADALATDWIYDFRFRDAQKLLQNSIAVSDNWRLQHSLGRASFALGETADAHACYQQALALAPKKSDLTSEADQYEYAEILDNLSDIKRRQGKAKDSLVLSQQALQIKEANNDTEGKATTLLGMACARQQLGEHKEAYRLYQQVLQLNNITDTPRLKTATMHNVSTLHTQKGRLNEALALSRDSLQIEEATDNTHGKAATLHQIANIYVLQGKIAEALKLYEQSFAISETIGATEGKAANLHRMASIYEQQGQASKALTFYEHSLQIKDQIEHIGGKAYTLTAIASVHAQQGEPNKALLLYEKSIQIQESIGDMRGKATTISQMAHMHTQHGSVDKALTLWEEELQIREALGDTYGKAIALYNIAWATSQQSNTESGCDLALQSISTLVTIGAWIDVHDALTNLRTLEDPRAMSWSAQAAWLTLATDVSVEISLNSLGALILLLGLNATTSPWLAAAAIALVQIRGADHPKQEEFHHLATNILFTVAEAHKIVTQKEFDNWLEGKKFNEAFILFPKVRQILDTLIGDHWLFDPNDVPSTNPLFHPGPDAESAE